MFMIRLLTATFCRLGAVGPHCGLVRHTQRERERENRGSSFPVSTVTVVVVKCEMYALPVPKSIATSGLFHYFVRPSEYASEVRL